MADGSITANRHPVYDIPLDQLDPAQPALFQADAVLPIFEKENGLLYYPTFYEGLEQSKNVIYTGQEATQQILASLDWIAKTKGAKTFYLVGSDYIWPRTSMKI
eukprot:gene23311-23338_t